MVDSPGGALAYSTHARPDLSPASGGHRRGRRRSGDRSAGRRLLQRRPLQLVGRHHGLVVSSQHRLHPHRRPVLEPDHARRSPPTSCSSSSQGETFDHYFVADSLCCPSRSTIFTGLFPHDTHVATNLPPDGGFTKFQSEHLDTPHLRRGPARRRLPDLHARQVPQRLRRPEDERHHRAGAAGLDRLARQQRHRLPRVQLRPERQRHRPPLHGPDELRRRRDQHRRPVVHHGPAQDKPFVVEAATFAPHAPYTPAPRNAERLPRPDRAPRPVVQHPEREPTGLAGPAAPARPQAGDQHRRDLPQAGPGGRVGGQAAGRHGGHPRPRAPDQRHLHRLQLRQRLPPGPAPAGPRASRPPSTPTSACHSSSPGRACPRAGRCTRSCRTSTCYPTFEQLAGAKPPAPGRRAPAWCPCCTRAARRPRGRTVALVEHQGNDSPSDPDYEGGGSNPTTYEAIRISAPHLPGFSGPVEAVYVEYDDPQHELEYYDIARIPTRSPTSPAS